VNLEQASQVCLRTCELVDLGTSWHLETGLQTKLSAGGLIPGSPFPDFSCSGLRPHLCSRFVVASVIC